MAQHDYVIANGTGAAVRSDLNNSLAAIVSNNSGATEPATMYAYQWWANTTTGLLLIRNAANSAWVTVGTLANVNLGLLSLAGGTMTGALAVPLASAATPSLTFTGDLNTGLFSPGADQVAISINGVARLTTSTTAVSSSLAIDHPLGAVGTPSITFTGDLNTGIFSPAADTLAFVEGGAEAARIDSSGRLLVGTSSARSNINHRGTTGIAPNVQFETATANYNGGLSIINNSSAGYAAALTLGVSHGTSIGSNTIGSTGSQTGTISFSSSDGTKFIDCAQVRAEIDETPGANDMPGRLVFSTTADGASSPTERMRITRDGSVLVGKIATAAPVTVGCELGALGYGMFTRASETPLFVNRTTSDGTLVDFRQDNAAEGSISVSGTTVSYNGAHLSRWSQLASGAERTEILRGSVLSNLDEMCEWGEEDNEQLNRMKVSNVEGDKNVSGVFQSWDDDDDTYTNDFYCAMTGDFIIRIAEGVTVERGDLLISAGDGTAKTQDDDIIRSKTIAKVTSTNVSCTYEDGSYCVPCVLMAC